VSSFLLKETTCPNPCGYRSLDYYTRPCCHFNLIFNVEKKNNPNCLNIKEIIPNCLNIKEISWQFPFERKQMQETNGKLLRQVA
jgi:hypothetical protein